MTTDIESGSTAARSDYFRRRLQSLTDNTARQELSFTCIAELPNAVFAYASLFSACLALRETHKALPFAEKALKKFTGIAKIAPLTARIFFEHGQWEKAEKALAPLARTHYLKSHYNLIIRALAKQNKFQECAELVAGIPDRDEALNILKWQTNLATIDNDAYLVRLFINFSLDYDENNAFLLRKLLALSVIEIEQTLEFGSLSRENFIFPAVSTGYDYSDISRRRREINQDPSNLAYIKNWCEAIKSLGSFKATVYYHFLHYKLSRIKITPGACAIDLGKITDIAFPSNQDVCIWPAESNKVIFVFTGGAGIMGVVLPMLHEFLAPLKANVVYLRDPTRLAYNKGIRSLADDKYATAKELLKLTSGLGTSEIYCFGNSGGGYGALLFGKLLRAKAVCSIVGPTTFGHEYLLHDKRYEEEVKIMQAVVPDDDLDMVKFYGNNENGIRVTCYYGESMPEDAWQANRFKNCPHVNLIPVNGLDNHMCMLEMLINDSLESALQKFIN